MPFCRPTDSLKSQYSACFYFKQGCTDNGFIIIIIIVSIIIIIIIIIINWHGILLLLLFNMERSHSNYF